MRINVIELETVNTLQTATNNSHRSDGRGAGRGEEGEGKVGSGGDREVSLPSVLLIECNFPLFALDCTETGVTIALHVPYQPDFELGREMIAYLLTFWCLWHPRTGSTRRSVRTAR